MRHIVLLHSTPSLGPFITPRFSKSSRVRSSHQMNFCPLPKPLIKYRLKSNPRSPNSWLHCRPFVLDRLIQLPLRRTTRTHGLGLDLSLDHYALFGIRATLFHSFGLETDSVDESIGEEVHELRVEDGNDSVDDTCG